MVHITNEIGKLKKVLLYRPGCELLNMIPSNMAELLFDDIPYLKVAQKEHDCFAEILKENDVEIVYLDELMAETLTEHPELRPSFLKQFIAEANVEEGIDNIVFDYLNNRYSDNLALVRKLIAGLSFSELKSEIPEIRTTINEALIIKPLVNLYFQRDPMSILGDGVSIHHMKTQIRQRETLFGDYIFRYHTDFKDTQRYYDRSAIYSMEGGDVLNLSKDSVVVGISERTTLDAVRLLSKNLFSDPNSKIRNVYALFIPKKRAYMHLDTVFTQISLNSFILHPSIVDTLKVLKLSKGNQGEIIECEKKEKIDEILVEILKVDQVELLYCGGGDVIASEREQWNDGSNTLCVAPGKVITYDRNEITNQYLRDHGIEVIEIPSSELSRGRGGTHCMSLALVREDI